jgi:hypothetical protein
MRAAGNDPEWITYAGERHGFGITKSKIDFAQKLGAFLFKHLAP